MSAHAYLRVATRAAHDQVDSLLSGFDLGDRANYARFLTVQAAAFLPIEQALEEAGAESVIADWPDRRRSLFLRDDLDALDAPFPPLVTPPLFTGSDDILGGLYVLEGSRLGGAMLSRSVGPGLPQRFLGAAQPTGGWKGLMTLLEQLLASDVQRERAGKSAIQTFNCFFRAATSSVEA